MLNTAALQHKFNKTPISERRNYGKINNNNVNQKINQFSRKIRIYNIKAHIHAYRQYSRVKEVQKLIEKLYIFNLPIDHITRRRNNIMTGKYIKKSQHKKLCVSPVLQKTIFNRKTFRFGNETKAGGWRVSIPIIYRKRHCSNFSDYSIKYYLN